MKITDHSSTQNSSPPTEISFDPPTIPNPSITQCQHNTVTNQALTYSSSSSSSSSRARITTGLPTEVIRRICARLPVADVLNLEQVSRELGSWKNDPEFVESFDTVSKESPMILIENVAARYCSLPWVRFMMVDKSLNAFPTFLDTLDDSGVVIRASCSGVLCCASLKDWSRYYVVNPTTMLSRNLPPFQRNDLYTLNFEDTTLVGLSCKFTNDFAFKVVVAGPYAPHGCRAFSSVICRIYSSSTEQWTSFEASRNDKFTELGVNQCVFVNECLHWLAEDYILFLHVDNQIWGEIHLPDALLNEGGARLHLLELAGNLSLFRVSNYVMDSWVMEDYESRKWKKNDEISTTGLNFYPINQSADLILMVNKNRVCEYDRRSRSWMDVSIPDFDTSYPFWVSAHAYRSTIFPLR